MRARHDLRHDGAARSARRAARGGPRRSLGAVRCRRRLRAQGPAIVRPPGPPPTGSRSCSPRRRCESRASRCRRCLHRASPAPPAFALEDQLAGPNAAHHVAVSAQARDGRVRVAIVARSLVAAIVDARPERGAHRRRMRPRRAGDRLEMVRARTGRRGLRAPAGRQRVSRPMRRQPMARFRPSSRWRCAQARRGNRRPLRVRVDAPVPDEPSLARWQRETGVEFVARHAVALGSGGCRGVRRRHRSPAAGQQPEPRDARALDLGRALRAGAGRSPARRLRSTCSRVPSNGRSLRLQCMARRAGMDVARRHGRRGAGGRRDARRRSRSRSRGVTRELRHAHGLPAPDDALPLLARAAPALAALPRGIGEARVVCRRALDARARARGRGRDRRRSTRACAAPACRRSLRPSPTGARMRFGGS